MSTDTPATDQPRYAVPVLWVLVLLVLAFALRCAWISDDAEISIRVAENFLRGDGLAWNPGERVQVYTHPLWMIALIAVCGVSGSFYLAPSVLGLMFTALALWRFAVIAPAPWQSRALVLFCFAWSPAFVDFSTSGLENPLTHFLLILFGVLLVRRDGTAGWLRSLALLGGLLALTRPDSLVLIGPASLWAFFVVWRNHRLHAVAHAALGLIPLFAWLIFSVIYYGFLFPNSAYAKLGHGTAPLETAMQGFRYLGDALYRDPVIVAVIVLGVVLGFIRLRDHLARGFLALGVILHLVYIVKIGGDFMSGRFLTAPATVAAILIVTTRLRWSMPALVGTLAVVVMLGLLAEAPTVRPLLPTDADPQGRFLAIGPSGIANERRFYSENNALARISADVRRQKDQRQDGPFQRRHHVVTGWLGGPGRAAGPSATIIDPLGVGDAFLARLPAKREEKWRPGHWRRILPAEYLPSLVSGTNQFPPGPLRDLYGDLRLATTGPFFTGERWHAILRLNTPGHYHLDNPDQFQFPPLPADLASLQTERALHLWHEEIARPPASTDFGDAQNIHLWDKSLLIYYPETQRATSVEISSNAEAALNGLFLRSGVEIGRVSAPPSEGGDDLSIRLVPIPEDIAVKGFDQIEIQFQAGSSARGCRIGFVRVASD